jgi:MHS family proline/betaine transporter-like MFS transporter
VTVLALFFAAALCPLAGLFSDLVGRRATIATTCIFIIASVYPAFSLGGSGNLSQSLLGVALLAVGAVLSGVVTAPLLSEVFATKTRYTGSAITYNLAYTIFGGTAPLVATWLISETGTKLSPAYYLIAVSIFAMIGGLSLRETSKTALEEAGPASAGKSDRAAVERAIKRTI